ncbi:single-stranded DNA-binding protein [Actinobacillus delphinicola]|uniref:Single-stranded DNA-binding protein n=1 Tax=Actinobacillus delphinicola TaxID=51161 RepID=A0A448TTN8_9PAST|nr:single-stranded DNA-binding protein [Actinobacillus delphinicola]MDG6897861.1 single-stranded DNA-binding protein [Actinobacillus delphinicola]VEJ09372.1 single-stranded DNA-binding protein [Actinobacillus delphinicola]
MAGLNRVMIMGNLGSDPESKVFPDGNMTTVISVATSISWLDKITNERKEKTEWHRIVLFRRMAEVAKQYLHKGSKVFIEGRLQTRKYQDQHGNDRYILEIIGESLQLLDKRPDIQNNDISQSNSTLVNDESMTIQDIPPLQDGPIPF